MRCINSEVGKRLVEYEANFLREEERRQFEDHLRSCNFCAEELGTMVATLEAVTALPPAWVVEELLSTGRELLRQESWEDAMVTFRALLRIAPDHQEAQEGSRRAEEQLPAMRWDLSSLKDRVVTRLSSLWQPRWVGKLRTAAATQIPEQKHVFRMEDGKITLSCSWRSRYHENPAHVQVSWRTDIPTPGELWVRFTRSGTETILAEVRLGTRRIGKAVFTSDDLGFDPSREGWAISLILREGAS
jgi:hypothetical protein